jgi:hypothetical protein
MLRWGRPRLLIAALAIQAVIAIGGMAVVAHPELADRFGLSSALKSVRGGRELTAIVVDRAKAQPPSAPLTAVAVDERELFNTMAYYGRDYFGKAGPPLKAWLRGPAPTNEAERAAPLTVATGGRVLVVINSGGVTDNAGAPFQRIGDAAVGDVLIDRKHHRSIAMFVAEGFKGPGR